MEAMEIMKGGKCCNRDYNREHKIEEGLSEL